MRFGLVLLGLHLAFAWGEEPGSPPMDSAGAIPVMHGPPIPTDSAAGNRVMGSGDSLPKTRADSVVLIRHRFNHREQIITGGVVMSCIAAIMAIMNNYNPR